MASTTSADAPVRADAAFVFSRPLHLLAFGFGTGLSPAAPGTVGTLLGVGLYLLAVRWLPDAAVAGLIVAMLALGPWICGSTGRRLGVADHGGIVWDEIAAIMLVLFFTPAQALWQGGAFLLFRFFDIVKPWPIRNIDRGFKGGFGVMADDVVAAFYALLCLALVRLVTG